MAGGSFYEKLLGMPLTSSIPNLLQIAHHENKTFIDCDGEYIAIFCVTSFTSQRLGWHNSTSWEFWWIFIPLLSRGLQIKISSKRNVDGSVGFMERPFCWWTTFCGIIDRGRRWADTKQKNDENTIFHRDRSEFSMNRSQIGDVVWTRKSINR